MRALVSLSICFLLFISFAFSDNYTQDNSEYRLSYSLDGALIGSSVAFYIAAYSLYSNEAAPNQNDILKLKKSAIPTFERFCANNYSDNLSKTSDYLAFGEAGVCGVIFLSSIEGIDKKYLAPIVTLSETMLLTSSLAELTKISTERYRPYEYNKNAPLSKKLSKDAKASFFSEHTAMTFALAVSFSKTCDDYFFKGERSAYSPYLWSATLGISALTGAFRILSGSHFVSDVATGALIGSTIGWLVPELHKTDSKISVLFQPNQINFVYNF